MANGIVHIDYDGDPRRCQAVTANGQCRLVRSDASQYCVMHGGPHTSTKEKILRQYRLAQWQARVDEFADHSQVKGLREEIGISRMMLEAIINQCKDQTDLLLYSNKITDLVTRIEKLVVSCNRLESSMGMLLDKQQALNLASQIVTIIGQHVDDDEIIDVIADDITMAILQIQPEKAIE